MKRVVLFDMDGVIVNTEIKHYLAWKKAFELEDISLSKSEYKKSIQSQGRDKGISNMIPNVSAEVLKRISDNKSLYYEELINEGVEVYSDAFLLIKQLANTDIRLGLVSSSTYASTVLEKINLASYFEFIIAGTKGLNIQNKPSPDIYQHAMRKMNVPSEETLVIEDSITGITSALKAGCAVLGVERERLNIEDPKLVTVKSLTYNIVSQLVN